MIFKYTLEEDDLKEYYQEALKKDRQVISFKWKLRISGIIGGAAMMFFNKLNSTWIWISLGIVVIWLAIVQFILYPGYIRRISRTYLEKNSGEMKEMTVEVNQQETRVDGSKKLVVDCAVFPTLVVLVLKGGNNIIIPNRVLDNDINNLNQLVDNVEKQMVYQAELAMKKEKKASGK